MGQSIIRPSKMLVDSLANVLSNNPEFVLIDEQNLIFDILYHLITNNKGDDNQVIIVEGGAGTGKSVITIELLAKLIYKK